MSPNGEPHGDTAGSERDCATSSSCAPKDASRLLAAYDCSGTLHKLMMNTR